MIFYDHNITVHITNDVIRLCLFQNSHVYEAAFEIEPGMSLLLLRRRLDLAQMKINNMMNASETELNKNQ